MPAGHPQFSGTLALPTAVFLLLAVLLVPGRAEAITLTADTVWQGEMAVQEDVLVPDGITLTILPATRITIMAAESTKTDPEYLSHLTEITVRGKLLIQGTENEPAVFSLAGARDADQWAGIIVDHGSAVIRFCTIRDADTALLVLNGSLDISRSLLEKNRYSLVGQGDQAKITLTGCRLQNNEYGPFTLDNAGIMQQDSIISANSKRDSYAAETVDPPLTASLFHLPEQDITRVYQDDVLLGTTVWEGRIVVKGRVRLPTDGRLIITPGTLVEFTRNDTNGDGIGENGLMIQGILIAKGTGDKPIIFRSGEPRKNRGDWDSINILGSEQTRNLIEFCQIEDAYRGLHFHFSNVLVSNSILVHNYRGIQFQESLVTVLDTQMYGNKSGIRARDSEVVFRGNHIFNNIDGANFFRLNLQARDNIFANNASEGVRIREGAVIVENNIMQGNRFGLLVNDTTYGKFSGNIMDKNLESGLALRNTDHVEISGNSIRANGINGAIIRDSRAAITGNLIADNGERGLGIISFAGTISNNNIVNNGLYAIGLDGEGDITAAANWWGQSDLDREIYDRSDDPGLGRVFYEPRLREPVPFVRPVLH